MIFMSNSLTLRQKKIQEKRQKTSWRKFLMEVCSWFQVSLYRHSWLISRFPETERSQNIYWVEDYMKQFWDGNFCSEIDTRVSFFQQFQSFFSQAPKMTLMDYGANENSLFADTVYGAKNAYMSFSIWDTCENVLYSSIVSNNAVNVYNSIVVRPSSENVYFWKLISQSHNIFYSNYIHNSSNIWFSDNLLWCHDCLFCSDLENARYCIKNEQYTQEEFVMKKAQLLKQKDRFEEWYSELDNVWVNRNSKHVSWSAIAFSEDVENGYIVSRQKWGRNVVCSDWTPLSENKYDVFDTAKVDHVYGWMWVWQWSEHMYCWANATHCFNVYYSYFMDSCSYCLWCVWLKNATYCIFNKQYTKDEWHKKVDEIFWKMEDDWVLWDFFPGGINPFYFNDTVAYLIDSSFTKEEVETAWYLRRDEPIQVDIPKWVQTIHIDDLWQFELRKWDTWYISENVLKYVVVDDIWNAYRIIPLELEFLVKHWLPLPRQHWLDRMKWHFKSL